MAGVGGVQPAGRVIEPDLAGDVPAEVAWSIIVANIVVKGITSVVTTPMIYAVRDDARVRDDVLAGSLDQEGSRQASVPPGIT